MNKIEEAYREGFFAAREGRYGLAPMTLTMLKQYLKESWELSNAKKKDDAEKRNN